MQLPNIATRVFLFVLNTDFSTSANQAPVGKSINEYSNKDEGPLRRFRISMRLYTAGNEWDMALWLEAEGADREISET